MNCKICAKEIDFNFYNADEMRRKELCNTCCFWWEKVEWRANGDNDQHGRRVVRIQNNHYLIAPDVEYGPQGFGGREHVIRFDSGDEVTTHNLWHQGEIPKWFREHLPNNATFVDTRLTCSCRAKFHPITPTQTKCLTCVLYRKPQRW